MLLKIVGVLTFIIVVVGGALTFGTLNSTTLAQEETDWKTYYNSSFDFSVDYPIFNGTTNITGNLDGMLDTVMIKNPDLVIRVNSIHSTLFDPQEKALESRIEDVNNGLDYVSEVMPIYTDSTLGYGYFASSPSIYLNIGEMFFETSKSLYHITVLGTISNEIDITTFGDKLAKIQDSLKFFD